MTTEVRSKEWKKLCRHINEGSHVALITIEQTQPDGTRSGVIGKVPLQNISLDEQSDACNNLLVIEAGTERPVRHEIIEPIQLLLRQGDNGRFNCLEILAESGRTLLHFTPGVKPMGPD